MIHTVLLAFQLSAAPGIRTGVPLATMGRYLGRGMGAGITFYGPDRALRLRGDVTYLHFGTRTVNRPLEGTGPLIGITSSANVVIMSAGPQVGKALGGWRLAAGGDAGVAHVQSTGSTILAGDPAQVLRSNTYGTTTWTFALRALVSRRLGSGATFDLEGSWRKVGRSDFLREYHLPIGVISGIYLYPTPYSPSFLGLSASVGFAL